MPTSNLETFLSRAIRHHEAEGNLAVNPETGRVTLGPNGREWFSKRLNNSHRLNGPDAIAMLHKAMREGATSVKLCGGTYALVPVDAKKLRLPRTIKTYLAPQHCEARDAVSQAAYSALWV